MPETKTITLSYSGSVKPTKTSFMKPSDIAMNFDVSLELSASDIANERTIQTEFQKAMGRQLATQLTALNTWLAEKDRQVGDMVKRFQALQKQGFPDTPQQAKARAKTLADLGEIATELDALPREWTQMVQDWATNTREQQGLVAMKLAVKAARVTSFSDKNFRMRAGQAVKATLVIAAIAIGVAAIVLTAGTATPLVVGIAAAGLALGGIGSLGQLGKTLHENATSEKKLIGNLKDDIERVREALGAATTSGGALSKHVTELSNLIRLREDTIASLQSDLEKYAAPAKLLSDQMGRLNDPSLNPAEITKRVKAIDAMQGEMAAARRKVAKLIAANADARTLLQDLEGMIGDLGRLSVQPANTLLGNLRARLTSVDGVLDVAANVGGLMNAAAGVIT
jgi:hypothetical protein